jgi:hypothetical protein
VSERTIVERLTEYRDAMNKTAEGMIETAETIEAKYGKKAANTGPIRDAARLYALVAVDITHILDDEELKPFVVTGVV